MSQNKTANVLLFLIIFLTGNQLFACPAPGSDGPPLVSNGTDRASGLAVAVSCPAAKDFKMGPTVRISNVEVPTGAITGNKIPSMGIDGGDFRTGGPTFGADDGFMIVTPDGGAYILGFNSNAVREGSADMDCNERDVQFRQNFRNPILQFASIGFYRINSANARTSGCRPANSGEFSGLPHLMRKVSQMIVGQSGYTGSAVPTTLDATGHASGDGTLFPAGSVVVLFDDTPDMGGSIDLAGISSSAVSVTTTAATRVVTVSEKIETQTAMNTKWGDSWKSWLTNLARQMGISKTTHRGNGRRNGLSAGSDDRYHDSRSGYNQNTSDDKKKKRNGDPGDED